MSSISRSERENYWRSVIKDHADSGLSVSRFCRDRNLQETSFYRWRKKLSNATHRQRPAQTNETASSVSSRKQSPNPQPFVAVDLAHGPTVGTNQNGFEISLANGRHVLVPSTFDVDSLAKLIQLLESMPC